MYVVNTIIQPTNIKIKTVNPRNIFVAQKDDKC